MYMTVTIRKKYFAVPHWNFVAKNAFSSLSDSSLRGIRWRNITAGTDPAQTAWAQAIGFHISRPKSPLMVINIAPKASMNAQPNAAAMISPVTCELEKFHAIGLRDGIKIIATANAANIAPLPTFHAMPKLDSKQKMQIQSATSNRLAITMGKRDGRRRYSHHRYTASDNGTPMEPRYQRDATRLSSPKKSPIICITDHNAR